MKKSLIALFSISVTAGTTYLVYSQVKYLMIGKLIKLWTDEAKKKNKELDANYLKAELEHLYPWDIKLLTDYFSKLFQQASKEVLTARYKKIMARKIHEQVDLKSVESVFGES